MIGIYKITSPTNKIYIGQSVCIEKRFTSYKNLNGVRGQKALANSFFKHGVENHIFEIIEECRIDNLNERERYWQDYYDVLKYGLNCKLTATSDKSGCYSQEVKDKISKSHIGLKPSEASREKMRESAKNRIREPHTKEHCEAIGKAKKGKPLTKEHRLSLSKKVIDISTGIIYNSTIEAAVAFDLNRSTLIQYLNGSRTNKTTLQYL